MNYVFDYHSPSGDITVASDGTSVTGLWFKGQKYYGDTLETDQEERDLAVFESVREWLDSYFAGQNPGFTPPLSLKGSPFRRLIWEILCEIPYGEVTTYGEIAKQVASKTGKPHMSAQAVGGAVGHNPISIIVPCHRVVGTDGSLTGYAGGLDKKISLLTLEGTDMGRFYIPTKGTAL